MSVRTFPRHRRAKPRPSNLRVLHEPHIDPLVLEHAERLLAAARAGQIRSLVIVGSFHGSRDVFRASCRRGDPFVLIGALEWAKQTFLEDIETG